MFQSLIGTLKTDNERVKEALKAGFQSLIGTLKTGTLANDGWSQIAFQSLIGTLKTAKTKHYAGQGRKGFNP